jgi:hypothetical protein
VEVEDLCIIPPVLDRVLPVTAIPYDDFLHYVRLQSQRNVKLVDIRHFQNGIFRCGLTEERKPDRIFIPNVYLISPETIRHRHFAIRAHHGDGLDPVYAGSVINGALHLILGGANARQENEK